MPKLAHVALLIETSRAYGRGILEGVIQYQRAHGPWSIYFQPQGFEALAPAWLKNWKGDGILARIDNRAMAKSVLRAGRPVVDLRFSVPNLRIPGVGIDNQAVVEMALDHLTSLGFKRFGFIGLPRRRISWMDLRQDHFQRRVQEAGFSCHVFESPGPRSKETLTWEQDQERIANWLGGLPKPIGVMACNDDRGQQALDACRRAEIQVPDEVAVIGVDNDEILCNLAFPPLSSVRVDTIRVGYEAAALLDRLMAGAPPPEIPLLLGPRGVASRESTDVLATEDRQLAAAVRHVRQRALDDSRVPDLARQVGMTRRDLERKFRKLLGRTPQEEIIRVRVERAKHLLTTTDLSVATVGENSGFRESKYFCHVFRKKVGMPPGAYRKRMGGSKAHTIQPSS